VVFRPHLSHLSTLDQQSKRDSDLTRISDDKHKENTTRKAASTTRNTGTRRGKQEYKENRDMAKITTTRQRIYRDSDEERTLKTKKSLSTTQTILTIAEIFTTFLKITISMNRPGLVVSCTRGELTIHSSNLDHVTRWAHSVTRRTLPPQTTFGNVPLESVLAR
jgi:hypothetical protein